MNSIIKVFLIALMQFVLINAHAVNFEKRGEVVIDDLRYELNYNDYTATVLGFAKGKSQQFLTIPSKVAVKYDVTKIDSYAFQDDSTLFHVTIPSTVTDVGVFSFRRCKNLNTVFFTHAPKGRIIRSEAFNNDHSVLLAFTDFSGRYYGTLYEFYRSFATVEQRSKYAKEVIDNYKNHYIYHNSASNEKRTYIKFDASTNTGSVAEFPKQKAHNIYSYPKIASNTKMDIYMIDIKPKTNARYTFWNANQMKMDMSYYKNKGYTVKKEMSSTSGLQYVSSYSDQKIYWSFGKATYNDGKKDITLTPTRIYPSGSSSTFDFSFTEDEWNTVLYRTWTEVKSDNSLTTKVGQWVRCYNQYPYWRVAAVYDTHVAESSMTGSMAFWQENFSPETSDYEREVHIKGMYYRNNSNKKWVSVPSTYLSTDTGFNDKKGGFSYGANGNYFYGKAGNLIEGSQLEFEKKNAVQRLYTISQDSKPYMESLAIAKAYFTYNSDNTPTVYVHLYPYSTPIFRVVMKYRVENSDGTQTFGSVSVYDPNFKSYNIPKINGRKAKISITVYDVFDQTVSLDIGPY
ncbi:hypothetical protein H8356DRAFT_1683376 [Neocallimastix lanati (nom. inval.)]|jgi:hypothetical protein|uniref:Uncharacterized protein n=1 Tax=Neocallimastix californiae TaxID=1754190 RepID=A0A1Y2BYD7_9FUNG|nr:hypothetical protein H8356DRAFT_1683376 [Neocallimastix sp. JGI-2020a]ORY39684.1 hypothetical protein LY90DRAFT_704254 [Neocallimastix californiae]|eukprot:ORY39684.1 hypothetical protein LY90DRAFT_704254 [Neocallimastix californiae]